MHPRVSSKVTLPPDKRVDNARNIAHRRKGCKVSPLTICLPRDSLDVQYEQEDDAAASSSTSLSPIYAQPFASLEPFGTPSYCTPFKDIYSLTPTVLSPTEPPLLPPLDKYESSYSPVQANVFFGQDFWVNDQDIQPDSQDSRASDQDIQPASQAFRFDDQDIQPASQDFRFDDQDKEPDSQDSRAGDKDMHVDGQDSRVDDQHLQVDDHDFQIDDGYATLSPPRVPHCHDRHRDSAYFSTDESTDLPGATEQQRPADNPPWAPSSTKLLRQAIEHSLVDNLTRLPEIIASEVNRQVRQTLQASTTEIAAKLHKMTVDVSDEFAASSVGVPRYLSASQQFVNENEEMRATSDGAYVGPKRPSTLDLLGFRRRKHTYSYSCQDLLGDDMFPPEPSRTCEPPRVSAALSFADLGFTDEQMSSGLFRFSDQTISVPTQLQHLHRGGSDYRYVVKHSFPEVEVEGNLVELPYEHHLPIKEALTPLCRELSRSYLMKECEDTTGGARSKNILLKLNVNLDQLDGYQSDTSMEWDYFDQPDGDQPDSDQFDGK